ncbi:MAG: Ldh family oxidoreductase [Christensenellales bacterium]
MDGNKIILIDDLKDFSTKVLIKEGMKEDYAKITAEVLAQTDAAGTSSHGTKNLHNYIRKYRAGGMQLNAEPEIITEGPAYALIDSHHTMGMASAYKAMEMAIKKASEAGISCVCVRNSMHFGAAGYYSNMAAEKNMIGLTFSNVDANMTAPGARGMVLGNNPFSYAAPAGEFHSVFLDIAMSTVASLKVIQAQKDGKSVPDSWIIDKDGLPTTDPSKYPYEGAVQPMAAHKGYGLAVMVEILTGVLSGGAVMKEVPSWLYNREATNNVSHCFIVIDVSKFMPTDAFTGRMESMVNYLHDVPKAVGSDKVYYPGEIEWNKKEDGLTRGIPMAIDVVSSLEGLSQESGIPIKWM